MVDGFGEAGALGFGDAVVDGEAGFLNEGAGGGSLGLDGNDGGGVVGEGLGGVGAGGGEGGGGGLEGEGGGVAGNFVLLGTLHGG